MVLWLPSELNAKEISELKNRKDSYDLDDFISICQKKKININELEDKLLMAFSFLKIDKKGYVPNSSLIILLKMIKYLLKKYTAINLWSKTWQK